MRETSYMQAFVYIPGLVFCQVHHFGLYLEHFYICQLLGCYSIATFFYVFIANKAFFYYSTSMLEDGRIRMELTHTFVVIVVVVPHP